MPCGYSCVNCIHAFSLFGKPTVKAYLLWFCQGWRQAERRQDANRDLSSGLHDGERTLCRGGETGTAEGGGDDLVVTTARTEEVAEFAVLVTEAARGGMVLEAAHTAEPALYTA